LPEGTLITPAIAVTPSDVARHYDDLDRFYRAVWGEHVHHGWWGRGARNAAQATEHLVDLVADRLRLRPGEQVCDIGCGYGATARRLAGRYGARVTGVTVSAAQLAAAGPGPQPGNPRLLCADWLANAFPDGAFDAALAIESSEHMADLARFFAEAARTLRPGGRLVVCAWLAAPDASPSARRHLLEPICREGRLARLGTEPGYRAGLAAAGFRDVTAEDLSREVARTWTLCILRAARLLLRDAAARRFLADRSEPNRRFALTLLRLRLAYATRAMRYVLFTARKA
jgi:tocopherol O-methyltransferase